MGSIRKPRAVGYYRITVQASISKVLKCDEEEADQLNDGRRDYVSFIAVGLGVIVSKVLGLFIWIVRRTRNIIWTFLRHSRIEIVLVQKELK